MGRVAGEVPLHDEDLVQPLGHLIERQGHCGRLIPAVGDLNGCGQIRSRPLPDLASECVQRSKGFSNQPVYEEQAQRQDGNHGQQALHVERPLSLLDRIADMQFRHGQADTVFQLCALRRKKRHRLNGVGHPDGRKIVSHSEQEAAERQQGCAEQSDPQAQGHRFPHGRLLSGQAIAPAYLGLDRIMAQPLPQFFPERGDVHPHGVAEGLASASQICSISSSWLIQHPR